MAYGKKTGKKMGGNRMKKYYPTSSPKPKKSGNGPEMMNSHQDPSTHSLKKPSGSKGY